MSTEQEQPLVLDERTQHAVSELESAIKQRYPNASFTLSPATDNPSGIHLITTVDVDDTDEVLDAVIDRVVDLQVEEGIPLHVIPVRTPDRITAGKQQRTGRRRLRPLLLSKLGLLGRQA